MGMANYYVTSGSGGGATDVRLIGASWNNFESLKSRLIVAAGGGGGFWWRSTGVRDGGHGGGLIGGDGVYLRSSSSHTSITNATGGTQTSGGYSNNGITASPMVGAWGVGGSMSNAGGGGGGGYYGGAAGYDIDYSPSAGSGGSSFISGHNGCNAISAASTSSNIIHTGQAVHYSGLYFTNTLMIDGAGYQWTTTKGSLLNMPNLAGTGTMTGNTGHGQVKITPLN